MSEENVEESHEGNWRPGWDLNWASPKIKSALTLEEICLIKLCIHFRQQVIYNFYVYPGYCKFSPASRTPCSRLRVEQIHCRFEIIKKWSHGIGLQLYSVQRSAIMTEVFTVFLRYFRKIRHWYLNYVMITSFHVLSNSLFTN
jgi:hypothetical protein